MQDEVDHLALNYWNPHFQTLHYEGEWSAIPLRNSDGKSKNIIIAHYIQEGYKNTDFLNECPYLKEVLDHFECPLHTVRLMKLKAGAVIKEHRDNELYFEKGEIRMHIPVITHPDVEFYLDKERIVLKEGECWYGNFFLPHSVKNNSTTDRVHLVIDAVVNDWIKDIFNSDKIKHKKETDPSKDYNVYENNQQTIPVDDTETKIKIIAELRNMNTPTGTKIADEMEATLHATQKI